MKRILFASLVAICASHALAADQCFTMDQAKQEMLDEGLATQATVDGIKQLSPDDYDKFAAWVVAQGAETPPGVAAVYATVMDSGNVLVLAFDADGCMVKAGQVDKDDWASIFK